MNPEPLPDLQLPSVIDLISSASSGTVPAASLNDAQLRELQTCIEWGLPIETGGGKRIRLVFDEDALVPAWILRDLGPASSGITEISAYLRIGSTNEEALRRARAGAKDGTLVIAEHQTAGRGRQGRKWMSQPRAGLYFSLLLRPRRPIEHWPILTHVASVSLARVLRGLGEKRLLRSLPDIKWPNDVLLSGKKTAGILLEVATDSLGGRAAVVGVGVNIRAESIPADLAEAATALDLEARAPIPRRRLLVQFLGNFRELFLTFEQGNSSAIIEEWKATSTMWNGTLVNIVENGRVRAAVTRGLTESGALQIWSEDAGEQTILAGDVSLRLA